MKSLSSIFDEQPPRKCVDCCEEFATLEEVAHHWCEKHGGKR